MWGQKRSVESQGRCSGCGKKISEIAFNPPSGGSFCQRCAIAMPASSSSVLHPADEHRQSVLEGDEMRARPSNFVFLLWSLALIAPFVALWVGPWLLWSLTDRPSRYPQGYGAWLFLTVLAMVPFVVLARAGQVQEERHGPSVTRSGLIGAAVAGVGLFFVLWGLLYYNSYLHWKSPWRGGFNFGLAFIMLASPIWVGLAMLGGFFAARGRSGDSLGKPSGAAQHPSHLDNRPKKGVIYTESELEAMKANDGPL